LEPYLSYSFKGTVNFDTRLSKTAAVLPAAGGPEQDSITGASTPNGANWREMLQANACEPLLEGELDIAGLIMLGYKNDDISKETRYTLNTVKSYRKELYSKLQIHETRELFMKASKIDSQLRELLR
jgi:DNA-binding NarL/FixJ family response regulator